MLNRKRVLLLSAAMILLCMSVIVGATYALFTDGEIVENHLRSGNLDLKFERTYLEYTVLNDNGLMEKKTDTNIVDFTETDLKDTNLFGITNDRLIVPGSHVTAKFKISHDLDKDPDGDSNVAFDYKVYIKLTGGRNSALADQLYVTVVNAADKKVVDAVKLNSDQFNSASDDYVCIYSGSRVIVGAAEEFAVTVQFANITTDNGYTNNKAENQTVTFDMIVEAVQSTATPVNP